MTIGFKNESLDVQTVNGLDDTLLEPLYFNRRNGDCLRAPIGGTTDGLSTPKIIRILPGYDATGEDWWSGVIHDSAYRDQLEILCKPTQFWAKAHYTQAQADSLILEAMKLQGVGIIRRYVIYLSLRLFGSFAFRADRRKAHHINRDLGASKL